MINLCHRGRRSLSKLGLFIALAFLASCGPRYETIHEYAAPQSAEGRQCVFQCENTKLQCAQLEDMRLLNCQDRAENTYERCQLTSELKYNSCLATGGKYCIREYCVKQTCGYRGTCTNQYNRCFGICGGEVTTRQVCVANCD